MKKTLLVFAIALTAVTSCKKDRVCECTIVHTNYTGTTNQQETTTYKEVKKSEAKKLCQNKTIKDSTETSNGGSPVWGHYTSDVYTCKLK